MVLAVDVTGPRIWMWPDRVVQQLENAGPLVVLGIRQCQPVGLCATAHHGALLAPMASALSAYRQVRPKLTRRTRRRLPRLDRGWQWQVAADSHWMQGISTLRARAVSGKSCRQPCRRRRRRGRGGALSTPWGHVFVFSRRVHGSRKRVVNSDPDPRRAHSVRRSSTTTPLRRCGCWPVSASAAWCSRRTRCRRPARLIIWWTTPG